MRSHTHTHRHGLPLSALIMAQLFYHNDASFFLWLTLKNLKTVRERERERRQEGEKEGEK